MTQIKTLIIDDNPLARLALKHLVSKVNYLTLAGECTNPIDAINFLNKEKVDLVLLDIEMPEMSGLDLIRQTNLSSMVILTTAKPDYAVEAFEHKVIDYLIKPIALARFIKSMERAKELFEGNPLSAGHDDYFFFRSDGMWVKITFDEILYVQALGDYAIICTVNNKYTIHVTMKALDERLPANKFQRVHRSYIAAISKIQSVGESILSLGDKKIPLADSFKVPLLEKLNLFN